MKNDLTDVAVMAVLVASGCALTYLFLRASLRRSLDKKQRETDRRLDSLVATLQSIEERIEASLEARLDEQGEVAQMQAVAAPEFTMEAAQGFATAASPAVEQQPVRRAAGEISPETMAVLTEAVAAFLGKKVRILSAKLLESPNESVNAWSQQGRVFVQASHNLRSRG